jgi:hypothetical protein
MNFLPINSGVFSADVVIPYAAGIGIIGGDVVKVVSWMGGFGVMPTVISRAMLQGGLSSWMVARVRRAVPTSSVVIVRIVIRIVFGRLFVHDEPFWHT